MFAGAILKNAIALAAFDVQVDSAKANGVRVGLGPVDKLETIAHFGLWLLAVFQRKQVVLPQPGVGIERAAEGVEAVIGENDQQRVLVVYRRDGAVLLSRKAHLVLHF